MDVRALTGTRPTGVRRQQIIAGIVSREQPAPASTSAELCVTVPDISSDALFRFASWPDSHPGRLPARGDTVILGYTQDGRPHVLSWEPS